jgi:hypothetical protein
MHTYVIHHRGYSFWLTYEKIIPARRDRINTRVSFVDIWRGEESIEFAQEPHFAELKELFGEGHGEQQALERLQTLLEKTSDRLQLEPLTEGAVQIANKTFGFRGRSQQQPAQKSQRRKTGRGGKPRSNNRPPSGNASGSDRKKSDTAREGTPQQKKQSSESSPNSGDNKKRPRRRGRRRGGSGNRPATSAAPK